jgi:protocatechuate 3,4-dioxygenase beta subunit
MDTPRSSSPSRREVLKLGLGAALLVACRGERSPGHGAASGGAPPLQPTPAVDDGDERDDPAPVAAVCAPTAGNIEGPFFKPGAPHRSVLVGPGDPGARIRVSGAVRSTDCRPVGGVAMEIWQADARGAYDLEGFRHRGRLVTRADGAFEVQTIVPGRYLNGRRHRPAHLHVKLSAPGHRPLTTQLYFDGDPYNHGDAFFLPSLVMQPRRAGAVAAARFDFVLERIA